jgi:hypothetical protein
MASGLVGGATMIAMTRGRRREKGPRATRSAVLLMIGLVVAGVGGFLALRDPTPFVASAAYSIFKASEEARAAKQPVLEGVADTGSHDTWLESRNVTSAGGLFHEFFAFHSIGQSLAAMVIGLAGGAILLWLARAEKFACVVSKKNWTILRAMAAIRLISLLFAVLRLPDVIKTSAIFTVLFAAFVVAALVFAAGRSKAFAAGMLIAGAG